MEKKKLKISEYLKRTNKEYFCNITLQMVAKKADISRETLSRLTTDSSFSLLYDVCGAIYDLYCEKSTGSFSFKKYNENFEFSKMLTDLINDNYIYIS